MNISERRQAANQRNAQQSTGPRTVEGKARSSRNATTHGLTALLPALGPEAEQTLAERIATCRARFLPRDVWECWLVDELATVSVRLGRVGTIENQLHELAAFRASNDLWDADRRSEVETIAAGLGRRPAQVVAKLRLTSHGCEWLIQRWSSLARLAEDAIWTDEQTQLAHDLLGTPLTDRSEPLVPAGTDLTPTALARREITRLETLRTFATHADEATRSTIRTGWSDIPSRDVANLRRYERSTHRYLAWIMDQIAAAGLQAQTPSPEPAPVPPEPALAPPRPEPARPPAPRAERNEPITPTPARETKPLGVIPPSVLPEPIVPTRTPKRPDPVKIAQRERKARRKRGQRRHQS